jgi:hypothetical protein
MVLCAPSFSVSGSISRCAPRRVAHATRSEALPDIPWPISYPAMRRAVVRRGRAKGHAC